MARSLTPTRRKRISFSGEYSQSHMFRRGGQGGDLADRGLIDRGDDDDVDEAMEDDQAIIHDDEEGADASDEGEGDDLVEGMEAYVFAT